MEPQKPRQDQDSDRIDAHIVGGEPNLFFDEQGLRPAWALLLYLAIVLTPNLMLDLTNHLAAADQPQPQSSAVYMNPLMANLMAWLPFGFVFFATWIMARIEDRSVRDYGLTPRVGAVRRILPGALWGLACVSLLIALLLATHYLAFDGVLLRPASALAYGLAWALSFLGVGFFEEFLFRGYLQFTLTRFIAELIHRAAPRYSKATAAGFWAAATLISFGFGLLHSHNSGESPIGLLCASCAGLLFAFSLWRTGSLWWAIGFHAMWDWCQSYLFGVADSGTFSAGHLLASRPVGPALLSGGTTGPEGSVFVFAVMPLIALIIAFTLPRRTGCNTPWSGAPSLPEGVPERVHSPRA